MTADLASFSPPRPEQLLLFQALAGPAGRDRPLPRRAQRCGTGARVLRPAQPAAPAGPARDAESRARKEEDGGMTRRRRARPRRPGRRLGRPRRAARAPPGAASRGRGRHARPRAAGRGRRARHVRHRAAAHRRPARPGRRAGVAARDPRQRLPGAAAAPAPEPVADDPPAAARQPVEDAIERLALRDWVWTALDRLSPAAAARGRAAVLLGASSYEAIADLCGVPVGTVRSRLNAARAKLADALLETAAERPPGRGRDRRLAAHRRRDDGVRAQRRSRACCATSSRPTCVSAVRPRRAPRPRPYAALLARDFEDGVTRAPERRGRRRPRGRRAVAPQPPSAVHCPPAVTQILFHDGHAMRRIVAHYAALPA